MALRSKSGEKLFRKFTVKFYAPGNSKHTERTYRAEAGKAYSDDDMERALHQLADAVERHYPADDFGLVQTAPNAFSFVHRQAKPIQYFIPVVRAEATGA